MSDQRDRAKLVTLGGLDYFNKNVAKPHQESIALMAQAVTLIQQLVQDSIGDMTALNTTANSDLVSAINELKFGVDAAGEPFRIKQWASTFNVEVPSCMEDVSNTNIPKFVFKIEGQEAVDYQVTGLLAYEVFDATTGGNRINFIPVCQFTGQGQTELSVRGCVMGTTSKIARRINGWVLLKHR